MTTELYPQVFVEEEIIPALQEISRKRNKDITDFSNLDQRFTRGRRTERVPTSATDVVAGDSQFDVVNDATYEYILLDIGGTLRWDRRTLNTSW
jgi:hypothetical protein